MPRVADRVLEPPSDDLLPKFVASLDPEWIDEALAASGTATIRRRRLPAEQVIWLVIGMCLFRDQSMRDLVSMLDLALPGSRGIRVAPSSIVQARERLGDEPLRWLFERSATAWAHSSARKHDWRGLALYGVDGTTVRVPDSDENRAHFGGQNTRWNGESGYPLVRLVTLMALRSHVLAGARFGAFATHEITLAEELWPQIPDHSLAIVDRGFLSARILNGLERGGVERHWLTRARSDFASTRIERFATGDELVELEVSPAARKKDPTMPLTWRMRAIRYQRRGFKPQLLLTSMLDPKRFPAAEVIALYHERWEIELGYNEVKRVMLRREETTRSRKPRGVAQELWALALAYNLVRFETERVAEAAGVPPTRISFVAALNFIESALRMWGTDSAGRLPERLRRLREDIGHFVLPERRARSYPRAVKLKMSNYDRKRPAKSSSRSRAK
ncbi:MAG: IS4 family transposase [Kofleriaceae bacterium]|nr:IS4 family transposase [Kofleriaceae bacterium]